MAAKGPCARGLGIKEKGAGPGNYERTAYCTRPQQVRRKEARAIA